MVVVVAVGRGGCCCCWSWWCLFSVDVVLLLSLVTVVGVVGHDIFSGDSGIGDK